MHMKALKSLQYFDHNTQSISYKIHSSKQSWSFQNSHLKRLQLNPLSCFLSAFCKGHVIPFQSCALWAEMMRGLSNLCADFFCTKSDSVFSGTVVGMGKHQMRCDKETWSKMETFKFRLGSQSMSRSSSALKRLHWAWELKAEGKSGIKSLNQEGRPHPSSTKLCVWSSVCTVAPQSARVYSFSEDPSVFSKICLNYWAMDFLPWNPKCPDLPAVWLQYKYLSNLNRWLFAA